MRRNPHTLPEWWKTPLLREFWWDLTHPREVFRDFLDGSRAAWALIRSWKK